jgi:hypothetical protein
VSFNGGYVNRLLIKFYIIIVLIFNCVDPAVKPRDDEFRGLTAIDSVD